MAAQQPQTVIGVRSRDEPVAVGAHASGTAVYLLPDGQPVCHLGGRAGPLPAALANPDPDQPPGRECDPRAAQRRPVECQHGLVHRYASFAGPIRAPLAAMVKAGQEGTGACHAPIGGTDPGRAPGGPTR